MADGLYVQEDSAFASMPLFEHIKTHIYVQYEQALNALFLVNQDMVRNRAPRESAAFISAVLRLYLTLAPKLDYSNRKDAEGKPMYAMLRNLDAFILEPQKLLLTDAKIYFTYMRYLLEDLGITKIENRVLSGTEKTMSKLSG